MPKFSSVNSMLGVLGRGAITANISVPVGTNTALAGQALFTAPGTTSWTAPAGVFNISVACIGGGGAGNHGWSGHNGFLGGMGGGGGALVWRNNIGVTPGVSYSLNVGAGGSDPGAGISGDGTNGGDSWFISPATLQAQGGRAAIGNTPGAGGVFTGDLGASGGGGNGGSGGALGGTFASSGGGGAGGYSGNGGTGGAAGGSLGSAGAGGGGGGGASGGSYGAGGGGGTGILGQGTDGAGGASVPAAGSGGSSGGTGVAGSFIAGGAVFGGAGGAYGGGGGGAILQWNAADGGDGGSGAVRIIWSGTNFGSRSYPFFANSV